MKIVRMEGGTVLVKKYAAFFLVAATCFVFGAYFFLLHVYETGPVVYDRSAELVAANCIWNEEGETFEVIPRPIPREAFRNDRVAVGVTIKANGDCVMDTHPTMPKTLDGLPTSARYLRVRKYTNDEYDYVLIALPERIDFTRRYYGAKRTWAGGGHLSKGQASR